LIGFFLLTKGVNLIGDYGKQQYIDRNFSYVSMQKKINVNKQIFIKM